jgi:hypothetical protein
LAWCIEVCDPHIGIGATARNFNLIVIKTQNSSHSSWACGACFVHGVGAFNNQPNTIFKRQGTSGGERRVFAQAMSSAETGLNSQTLNSIEDHQAGHESGQLGVSGVFQLLSIGVKEKGADITASNVGCFFY